MTCTNLCHWEDFEIGWFILHQLWLFLRLSAGIFVLGWHGAESCHGAIQGRLLNNMLLEDASIGTFWGYVGAGRPWMWDGRWKCVFHDYAVDHVEGGSEGNPSHVYRTKDRQTGIGHKLKPYLFVPYTIAKKLTSICIKIWFAISLALRK